jgi:hypothetical protein
MFTRMPSKYGIGTDPVYTVPSESIHDPCFIPHFVVLQPVFKMYEIKIFLTYTKYPITTK